MNAVFIGATIQTLATDSTWPSMPVMFWNDPEGAEAILQVRAAALCDDGRLVEHLKTRPGYPFTRRLKTPIPPDRKRKS